MNFGIIGLGRMGNAIVRRALEGGHSVVAFDLDTTLRKLAADLGAQSVESVAEVVQKARILWLMVPAGEIVDTVIAQMFPHLQAGDIVIDGGNSKFTDSMRRERMLAEKNIFFLDCGTSGGVQGRDLGFSLMVGGDVSAFQKVEPLLKSIAAAHGYGHVGPAGAGHYVKMVHNGIEYGLLQAYAEGFQLIKEGSFKEHDLDLAEITRIWQNGSVVRSWLLTLSHGIFERDQKFNEISGEVAQGGTGAWTVEDAHKNKVQLPVIEESLKVREWSMKTGGNYATKIVALLRFAFGEHKVKKKE